MINADTIREVQFEKTAVFGYKAEDVDQFLAETAKAFEELMDRNEELEEKLVVLAEGIEEYREQEESLKTTLLAAQKLSDSLVKDAKAKAEKIIADAQKEVSEIEATLSEKRENAEKKLAKELEKESKGLVKMQKEVASFKANLLDLYKHHLDLITALPDFEDDEAEDEVAETEINETVAAEDVVAVEEAPELAETEEEAEQLTLGGDEIDSENKSIFADLTFGEDYSN